MSKPSSVTWTSKGKINKVKCRICHKVLIEQNYKDHIKDVHPSADENDLRAHSQSSLLSFYIPTTESVGTSSTCSEKTTPLNEGKRPVESPTDSTAQSELVPPTEIVSSKKKLESTSIQKEHSIDEKLDTIITKLENIELNIYKDTEGLPSSGKKKIPHVKKDKAKQLKFNDPAISERLQNCESLEHILEKITEFEIKDSNIVCQLCHTATNSDSCGVISIPSFSTSSSSSDPTQSFRNMKRAIKRHLNGETHTKALLTNTEDQEKLKKYKTRDQKVGETLGMLIYDITKTAKPDIAYEEQISLLSMLNVDVGELNHSNKFPAKFIPYLSNNIDQKIKHFFTTPMAQTGFKPALKITADKATYCHRTRQFIGCITVIPEAEDVIQCIFLGAPIVRIDDHEINEDDVEINPHTGIGIANNIWKTTSNFGIVSENYIGCAFDGQYHHLNVPHHLNELFGFDDNKKPADWDPMHRAGLVDTHIRKDGEFIWLNEITMTIADAFKLINYGKEFEHFIDVAEKLRQDPTFLDKVYSSVPLFYSKTKFANHCSNVYLQFYKDYPALFATFDETHMQLRDGTSREKEKSQKAGVTKNKLMCKKFAIRLCGICDIYSVFSSIVNLLQKVNMLPHIKFEQFEHLVKKMEAMGYSAVDHSMCGEKCCWPLLHENINKIVNENSFRGISLYNDNPGRASRKRTLDQYLTKPNSVTSDTDLEICKLQKLSETISEKLYSDVYGSDEKNMITTLKLLCDLKGLKMKVVKKGVPLIYSMTVEKFLKSAHQVSTNLDEIPESQLMLQYRTFLKTLENVQNYENMESIDYLKLFINTENQLFKECEVIVHIICTGAIFFSCESILESYVSMHEHKIDKHRAGKIHEERHSQELTVYINGPPVTKCHTIVNQAMNKYWQDKTIETKTEKWHFTRKSDNVKNYTVSKVVDRIQAKECCLPFLINTDL